jgi:nucleoside-diphosphate-sugar epimerase
MINVRNQSIGVYKLNILLAGGNGFIGSHIYARFESTCSIISLDNSPSPGVNNSVWLNLSDSNKVQTYVENIDSNIDVVIFLVGLAHAKGKGAELEVFRSVNFQTLVNLLQAFEKVNKLPGKIIFASTISVYGERYYQREYDESLQPAPFSPYAVTKFEAEKYLLDNYANCSWLLRFAPVYSKKFTLNIDRRTKIKDYFYKVGNGKNQLSLCNIDNIMQAVDGIIEDKVPPGVYNISDPVEYTYKDLLSMQDAKNALRIPKVTLWFVYILGKLIKNIFLIENSTKLTTSNIFPSMKIRSYVDLKATITNVNKHHVQ